MEALTPFLGRTIFRILPKIEKFRHGRSEDDLYLADIECPTSQNYPRIWRWRDEFNRNLLIEIVCRETPVVDLVIIRGKDSLAGFVLCGAYLGTAEFGGGCVWSHDTVYAGGTEDVDKTPKAIALQKALRSHPDIQELSSGFKTLT